MKGKKSLKKSDKKWKTEYQSNEWERKKEEGWRNVSIDRPREKEATQMEI